MSATGVKAENNTYRRLIGNGLTYRIPRFQRDYSWTEDEWEDLWTDLHDTLRPGGEPAHYMGYLVLQSDDDKTFEVIDGQQRMTTLALLVLAVLKNLQRLIDTGVNPEPNRQRLQQIRQTYVGYLDPVTLVTRSKLTLNRNNDTYFQNYLVPLERLPQRGLRASEHMLRKAFEWFDRHVQAYALEQEGDTGVALAQFVEGVSDRLFFTVISVTDELNAYKVFETLNARGVRLASTDLLKNYLFSVLHREREAPHELKSLEDRWEALVGRLGAESFPDFLRAHWLSRGAFARHSELFKKIRGEVTDREKVFRLLRELEEDLDLYLALTAPESSHLSGSARGLVGDLRMFNVRQPYPLLIAAQRRFPDAEVEALLRACVMLSFRYNVIGGLSPSEQEVVYASIAKRISSGEFTCAADAVEAMRSLYPSDERFRAAFADKAIRTTNSRNARVVRYVLCALERQETGVVHDVDSDTISIEHVLPQSPSEGWETFSEEELDAMTYRLGNMVLLRKAANRSVANKPWVDKRPVLLESEFKLTRSLAEHNEGWTAERLVARQGRLAALATAVWRVPQLD